jgi:arsenate reductase
MAEELLRRELGDRIKVCSAGLEPGILNPIVVDVLLDAGIDIRSKATRSVFEIFHTGKTFDYVITVCDESSGERCPIFPGSVKRLHWSFPDPSALSGSYEDKKAQTTGIKEQIHTKVREFATELLQAME